MKKKINKFFHRINVEETYADMKESQFKYLKMVFGRNTLDGLYTENDPNLRDKLVEKIEKIKIPEIKKDIESGVSYFRDLEVLDISTDDIKYLVRKYITDDFEHNMSFSGSILMNRKFSDSITLTKDQVKYLIDEYGEDADFNFGSHDAEELLMELGSDVQELEYHEEDYEDTEEIQTEIPYTVVNINLPEPKLFADKRVMKEVA